jgi:hypothetical protein
MTIEAIDESSFARSEGEISANDDAVREKVLQYYVGAKMHVVMAIHAICRSAIEALIFLLLCPGYIFKRRGKAGMIQDRREAVRKQEAGKLLLVLHQPGRAMRRGILHGEVQVEA